MIDHRFPRARRINVAALDAALRAALTDRVVGVSLTPDALIVHLTDQAGTADAAQVADIVRSHDPGVLTDEQRAAAAAAAKIAALRDEHRQPLDAADFADAPAPVQRLAARLAYVEAELRRLLSADAP